MTDIAFLEPEMPCDKEKQVVVGWSNYDRAQYTKGVEA
jgi:hypothetical protein